MAVIVCALRFSTLFGSALEGASFAYKVDAFVIRNVKKKTTCAIQYEGPTNVCAVVGAIEGIN